jgi:outer membrane receptor protein involved in Fe transport
MKTRLLRKGSAHALLALILGVFTAGLAKGQATSSPDTPPPLDSKPKDEVVSLEKFEVTGSHISGIDAAGLNPVTSISRATLDMSGYTDVGDALRNLSFVSGSNLIPTGSGNSFTPGASTVNVRGLGNNNVLVLLNGRRSAPLATPGFNGLQTVFDLNSIPTAAIDSIQVLKDGGSAIYGSDAVSGVINFITRKNYNGLTADVQIGSTTGTDSLEKKGSLVFGSTTNKLSIMMAFDWAERNSIKDRDYGFSSNADLTSRGGPDLRSFAGYPALVYVPSLNDYYTLAAPKVNPSAADFGVADVSHGSYNFQSVTDQLPETRLYGFFSRSEYKFTDTVEGFAEFSFRRSETKIEAAPTPVFNYAEHGSGPTTGYLNIPATNPNNPFGEDLEDEWYARLVNAGNRINNVTSDTPRILLGLRGDLPGDWKWETAAVYSKNKTENTDGGTVFDNLYQAALNGIVIGGETLYANPFGPEDPRVTASYTDTDPNTSTFEERTYDLHVNGPIFQLPAGEVKLAVGGEWRNDKLASLRTINNATGNVVGGAEGTSTFGQRTVDSLYAELHIPILKELQFQVAGRFEHYTDFGNTTKPKIALSYRPAKWLLFRTSFGQSFHAPDLAYIYTSQVTTFSSNPIIDPKRPADAPREIETKGGGNLNLQPEETDSWYAGFQIDPTGKLQGLELSLDFLQFKQKDLIAQLGEDFILSHEDTLPGLVVRNPPAAGETVGVINYINDSYLNIDSQTYRGVDFDILYTWKTASLGRFGFDLGGTYLEKLSYNQDSLEGTYDTPRWRGTFTPSWEMGDWSASVVVDYIGRFGNYSEVGNVKAQTTVNPQITYRGYRNIRFTVGARNVFNEDPPFDEHSSTGYNNDISNPEKAFVYFRVAKDF